MNEKPCEELAPPTVVTYERDEIDLETAYAGAGSGGSDRHIKSAVRHVSTRRVLLTLAD
jgi:hypothetical protein